MKRFAILFAALACLPSAACTTTRGMPSLADLQAVTERKPKPSADAFTPAGGDRYDNEVESWGERINAAGGRICRFYEGKAKGLSCPAAQAPTRHQ